MVSPGALDRARFQLPLLRVRAGAVAEGVVGMIGPLWFGVHWIEGRQRLCGLSSSEDCPLCALSAARILGMTLIQCALSNASATLLLEFSPLAWGQFEERCRFHGGDLREGVRVRITRPRARGCLRIEPLGTPSHFSMWLDGERRLLNAWAVLYGLPLATREETVEAFTERVKSVVQARARLVAGNPSV